MAQSPYGRESRRTLQSLVPIGSTVSLKFISTDRYGRKVAEVFKNQSSVNLAMVAKGQAVIYPQYFDAHKASEGQYQKAQSWAKGQRLGFWDQPKPVMSWEYRRASKPKAGLSQVQPINTGPCNPAYPDFCITKKVSCSTFKSQGHRQFTVLPPDPFLLDRDGDGIGCE